MLLRLILAVEGSDLDRPAAMRTAARWRLCFDLAAALCSDLAAALCSDLADVLCFDLAGELWFDLVGEL
jgi:hypothetical protein